MKKKKSEFIIGKLYHRIPNPVASHTSLHSLLGEEVVGFINLGTAFIMLEKLRKIGKTQRYKLMTSDGIIGWAPLDINYWQRVSSD